MIKRRIGVTSGIALAWVMMVLGGREMFSFLGLVGQRLNDATPGPLFPWWPHFATISTRDLTLAPITVPLLYVMFFGASIVLMIRLTYTGLCAMRRLQAKN